MIANILSVCHSCFLVSYYFTQHLLAKYATNNDEKLSVEVSDFIKNYGAYLRLHACLAVSAAARAESVIEELLRVAEYDPCHRDATREIQKHNGLTFYEAVSTY